VGLVSPESTQGHKTQELKIDNDQTNKNTSTTRLNIIP